MLKNLKLSQQALILLLVPLTFEIIFVTALAWQLHQFDELLREVNQSRQFGTALNSLVDDMAATARMIDDIKGSGSTIFTPKYASDMRSHVQKIETEIADLGTQAPSPELLRKVNSVAVPMRKVGKVISFALETYDTGGSLSLLALMKGQDQSHSRRFASLRDQLVDGLRGLLEAKHDQQIDFDSKIAQQEVGFKRMIMIVAVGGTFHVMLALFLWLNFSRGTAENFRILVDNTRRLAQGKPLNAPIQGGDEIAHLDHVFNDMAQALEAEKRKREEIEQMKQEFVAMISHDLRTPLTSVQACLTLLTTGMYGELSQQGTENVQMAEGNVTRLISLINDLLDIEKMESGKLKMELTGCSISDVFDRSLAAVVSFAQQQQVSLVMERTELRAIADGDRLVQVLVNLISNAIKFSPKDSQVTVSAQDKGAVIVVRVSDQGRGIPAEFRQSIFERFQQVKASDAKVKGGSGLGLAICKAIIEGHGGEIGVDSENKGSSFWFSVPKQSQLAEQHSEQPAAQPA